MSLARSCIVVCDSCHRMACCDARWRCRSCFLSNLWRQRQQQELMYIKSSGSSKMLLGIKSRTLWTIRGSRVSQWCQSELHRSLGSCPVQCDVSTMKRFWMMHCNVNSWGSILISQYIKWGSLSMVGYVVLFSACLDWMFDHSEDIGMVPALCGWLHVLCLLWTEYGKILQHNTYWMHGMMCRGGAKWTGRSERNMLNQVKVVNFHLRELIRMVLLPMWFEGMFCTVKLKTYRTVSAEVVT